jgi:hypothetical protein
MVPRSVLRGEDRFLPLRVMLRGRVKAVANAEPATIRLKPDPTGTSAETLGLIHDGIVGAVGREAYS